VLAAQDGEDRAVHALVERWQRPLWRHARNVTGRADAADDVTQEAWIGILRRLAKLNDPAAFPSWAYRIVTRRSVDWIRQQAWRRGRSGPMPDAVAAPDRGPPDIETQEQARVVADALQTLPVEQRALLSMHYLGGLPTAEIAHALNIPRGTVKSRLHTARQNLRTQLESE